MRHTKESSALTWCVHILYVYRILTMTEKSRLVHVQSHTNRHTKCPLSKKICKWTKLPLWKTLHLSKRSQQELASARLFISFFACIVLFYSSPGIFFNKIWSKRILEANIHSFVWRLVKEKKDAGCVYVWVIKYVYTLALWWQLMQS